MKNNLILDKLPNELFIDIVILLPLDDILRFSLVCSAFNDIVAKHQEIIYHMKCIQLGYASPSSTIDLLQAEKRSRDLLSGSINTISTWKQYCLFSALQDAYWPSQNHLCRGTERHLGENSSVWRVKTDTKLGLFVYTSTLGGLYARSVQPPHSLVAEFRVVSPFAHLEYCKTSDEEGYASTHGSRLDLWKIASVDGTTKFVHVAEVDLPFSTRASRMKHGTLSVAAANGAHVGLIDPTNGQVTKVIDTVPVPLNMRMINYIEQTQDEVLVLRGNRVEIYSKRDGAFITHLTGENAKTNLYLNKEDIAGLPSEDIRDGVSLSFQAVAVFDPKKVKQPEGEVSPEDYDKNYNMYSLDEDEAEREGVPIRDEFNGVNRALEFQDEDEEVDIFEILSQNQSWSAVHVFGNKLAAISGNRILIVSDYSKALQGNCDALAIQLPSTIDEDSSPMCFEYSRMIFELGSRLCILPLHEEQPSLIYMSEFVADDPPSAMQATEDAIISTYSAQENTNDWPHSQMIRWIDFSPNLV